MTSLFDYDQIISLSKEMSHQVEVNEYRWTMLHRSSDDLRRFLTPTNPIHYLFRGQSERYMPCVPSISRDITSPFDKLSNLQSTELLTFTTSLLKSNWFCQTILKHPAINWAKKQGIFIDRMALCQHYGIPTGYIDLTQSFDVAMFFATSNWQDGSWQPVTSGQGILYFFDYMRFVSERFNTLTITSPTRQAYGKMMKDVEELSTLPGAKPIGYQPMPRPAEQWGWVFESVGSQDFEELPYTSAIYFEHSQKLSEVFLLKFDEGRALFPDDPTSALAQRILKSDYVSSDYIEPTLEDLLSDPLGLSEQQYEFLKRELMDRAIPENQLPSYLPEELTMLTSSWERKSIKFFQSVGVTLVRTNVSGELETGPTIRGVDDSGNLVFRS